MNKDIEIDNKILHSSEIGYYNGQLMIWGKEVNAEIEVKGEVIEPDEIIGCVKEKITWINKNMQTVLEVFLKNAGHYLETFNELIKKVKSEESVYITLDKFKKSLIIEYISIYISEKNTYFVITLKGEPDYLLGHQEILIIDSNYNVIMGKK